MRRREPTSWCRSARSSIPFRAFPSLAGCGKPLGPPVLREDGGCLRTPPVFPGGPEARVRALSRRQPEQKAVCWGLRPCRTTALPVPVCSGETRRSGLSPRACPEAAIGRRLRSSSWPLSPEDGSVRPAAFSRARRPKPSETVLPESLRHGIAGRHLRGTPSRT